MYLAKPVVYLAICRVFEFFRLFKICVVYLAIFVVYLAIFVVYLAKPGEFFKCTTLQEIKDLINSIDDSLQ